MAGPQAPCYTATGVPSFSPSSMPICSLQSENGYGLERQSLYLPLTQMQHANPACALTHVVEPACTG